MVRPKHFTLAALVVAVIGALSVWGMEHSAALFNWRSLVALATAAVVLLLLGAAFFSWLVKVGVRAARQEPL